MPILTVTSLFFTITKQTEYIFRFLTLFLLLLLTMLIALSTLFLLLLLTMLIALSTLFLLLLLTMLIAMQLFENV